MTVYLVGAGPGDPGLLTVRGEELLRARRRRRVRPARVARAARARAAGGRAHRRRQGAGPRRDDARTRSTRCSSRAAATGRAVVRLKGGDPFVFGRGGEEAEACIAAGRAVRGRARHHERDRRARVRGHPGHAPRRCRRTSRSSPATRIRPRARTDTDWDALARAGGTLVILMGAGRVAEIAKASDRGRPRPDDAGCRGAVGHAPEQRTIRAHARDDRRRAASRRPSAIVVGEVAALDLGWFEHATAVRPDASSSPVRASRRASCATGSRRSAPRSIELPAIAIEPVDFAASRPRATTRGWCSRRPTASTRSSTAGSHRAGLDARALGGRAGRRDRARHRRRARRGTGMRADLVPERFVAESLLDAFPPGDRRACCSRGPKSRATCCPRVSPRRATTSTCCPCTARCRSRPMPTDLARVRAGDVDAITFTSSSTVDELLRRRRRRSPTRNRSSSRSVR